MAQGARRRGHRLRVPWMTAIHLYGITGLISGWSQGSPAWRTVSEKDCAALREARQNNFLATIWHGPSFCEVTCPFPGFPLRPGAFARDFLLLPKRMETREGKCRHRNALHKVYRAQGRDGQCLRRATNRRKCEVIFAQILGLGDSPVSGVSPPQPIQGFQRNAAV
jgi:hypothetical protein